MPCSLWEPNSDSRYVKGTVRMSLRLMQASLFLLLAGCNATPSQSAQATSERPFSVSEVTTFNAPWAMDFLPGSGVRMTNMALVTEKGGRLWLTDAATGQKQEVAGVPSVRAAGQGGLGDVVVHPDFAGNQRVYLSFAEGGSGSSGAAIGYGRLVLGQDQPRIEGFKVIWRQEPKVTG